MSKEKVKRIIDGDTFVTEQGTKVRLANVNAPEKGHKGSPRARKDLIKIISKQQVNINKVARDPYGRVVANVKIGTKSVNKAMKEKGWK